MRPAGVTVSLSPLLHSRALPPLAYQTQRSPLPGLPMKAPVSRFSNDSPAPPPPLWISLPSTCSVRDGVSVPMPTLPPNNARSGELLRAWPIQLENCAAASLPLPTCWNWTRGGSSRSLSTSSGASCGPYWNQAWPASGASLLPICSHLPLPTALPCGDGTCWMSSRAPGVSVPMPTLPLAASINRLLSVGSVWVTFRPFFAGPMLICHASAPPVPSSPTRPPLAAIARTVSGKASALSVLPMPTRPSCWIATPAV
ncbi:hypothetical protein D9M68_667820 [compost metagenome]